MKIRRSGHGRDDVVDRGAKTRGAGLLVTVAIVAAAAVIVVRLLGGALFGWD